MRVLDPPPRPPGVTPPPAPPPARGVGEGARLVLVRHAAVDPAFAGLAYGGSDVPLSAEGRARTEELGAAFAGLPVRRIAASDLPRAAAMGRAIAAATGAPLATDPRLREIDRGEWTGLTREAFAERWARDAERYWRDPWTWAPPGGESERDVFERAWPVVRGLLQAVEGGLGVVCAHGNLIRILLGRALGDEVPASHGRSVATAHLSVLRDDPAGFVLEAHDVPTPQLR